MKIEEAIKYFKHRLGCGQCGEKTTQRKAFKIAIECIEKQIPKKPLIIKYNGRTIPYCPICTNFLGKFADEDYREIFGEDWIYMNYCGSCGQRIDWSEVDE